MRRVEELLLSRRWDFGQSEQQDEFRACVQAIFRALDVEYLDGKRREFEAWWERFGQHLPVETLNKKRPGRCVNGHTSWMR